MPHKVKLIYLDDWPLTTQDDLIVAGASGVAARLAKGSDSQVLTVDPTTHHLVWATPVSGLTNPMTTPADLIVGGTSGAPTRLAKGSDSQVLTVDPTSHLLAWATPASGFSDPTTTKGDLIVHGSSTTRIGVGSDGQLLTADSSQTAGVKWTRLKAHGCRVYNSTTQSISNNADNAATFDSEDDDTDAYHSTSSNTSRITVPSGLDGVYDLTASVQFASNTTGIRYIRFKKNNAEIHGSDLSIVPMGGGNTTRLQITTHLRLAATDYVEFVLLQTSGGNLNAGGSSGAETSFAAYLVGA